MITLKSFNRRELEDFVLSGKFKTFDFLPITKHRALSQINNPIAGESDILLTLAFSGEKLAGYLGTFPDELMINNKPLKFAWLSTLYIDKNFRGQRIAQQLLDRVFEKYVGKIAITEFTKEAESLYSKTKQFDYIAPKRGKRFYFRSDFANIFPRKKPKLSNLKPIFRIIDFFLNSGISIKNIFQKTEKVNFELSENIDEESENFLKDFAKNRSTENLRWVIANPWILKADFLEENYQFSSYSKEFKYHWVKIYDPEQNLKTCALLQIRDQNLKISYLFTANHLSDFVNFLKNFIRKRQIKMLISYHPELNAELSKKKFPKIYDKDAERRYLFHNDLLKEFPEHVQPTFQDGDGDAVFT